MVVVMVPFTATCAPFYSVAEAAEASCGLSSVFAEDTCLCSASSVQGNRLILVGSALLTHGVKQAIVDPEQDCHHRCSPMYALGPGILNRGKGCQLVVVSHQLLVQHVCVCLSSISSLAHTEIIILRQRKTGNQ